MNSLRLSGSVLGGDVLGRDHRPLDHQDVESRLQHDRCEPFDTLRCERRARDHAPGLDLLDPATEQLRLHRLLVELLHPAGRLLVGEAFDLFVDGLGILIPRPEALEVEAREAPELPDQNRGLRRDARIHRRCHHREPEAVRVDLPADVDVVGITRPAGRHDRDLVEAVGPPGRLADTDLELHAGHPRKSLRERETPIRGPGWASDRCMRSAYQPSPDAPFSASGKPPRARAWPVPGGTDRAPPACGSRGRSSPARVRHACRRGPDPPRRSSPRG